MKWRKTGYLSAASECGCYQVQGAYCRRTKAFFWNAWYVPVNRHVAASHDKEFVKGRCEADAIFIDLMTANLMRNNALLQRLRETTGETA
jgi:hypothetical protein